MKMRVCKVLILIIAYIAISIVVYLCLRACGLGTVDQIRDFVCRSGTWSYVVFFAFQVIFSTFICIIPFEDELLTGVAIVLFGPLKGFLIASFNMFVTSCMQYAIGRYFCKSIIAKVVGGDSVEKYQKKFKIKGMVLLPALYLIPLFPHDSLCILSGISKMRFWYFAIVTLIMRSIEIASLCFLGSGLINFANFELFDWIVVFNFVVVDIYLLIKLQKFVENKIEK
jgi:uncharacterized membrane protein YdjX (TVP38/TMEM64 family)